MTDAKKETLAYSVSSNVSAGFKALHQKFRQQERGSALSLGTSSVSRRPSLSSERSPGSRRSSLSAEGRAFELVKRAEARLGQAQQAAVLRGSDTEKRFQNGLNRG